VNDPGPVPSDVFVSRMVGFADVLQQTPLAVIAPPPSFDIFPPLPAVVYEIPETAVVVNVGSITLVVNVRSDPYAVPTELVAYALT